ncbi:hypothetical protein [Alkalihalobacillus sp. BA299]|uniref:hypothetical protein n=1 Tax=Alkalihalobacillus sp. BA299 TaxID=2815938 RepID=UPI001ADC9C4B|nr:hypothetical protein [Alkalihalobacillus sp. BA299]
MLQPAKPIALDDLEEELLLAKESEEQDGTFSKLISVYEALFRKISTDRNSEYSFSLEGIKKRLVSYLVKYGTWNVFKDGLSEG